MLCIVSDDASGGSLPTRRGLWDRTEMSWVGQDAGPIAGVRELSEAREHRAADDQDNAPPVPD